MASPISTGGGGIHFESWVVAYYLASLLSGGTVLGHVPGSSISSVKCQRKDAENPIDDVKIDCLLPEGDGRLDLQVKRTLNFGDNELFREVIGHCWDTFAANIENKNVRFGLAIGSIEKDLEEHGRAVLKWARKSDSEQDFFERLATQNFASDGMRRFLEIIRSGVQESRAVKPTGDEFWQFLRRFVTLYFDFESGDGSHSFVGVTDRLRHCLALDEADKSVELWEALTSIADKTKPAAGSLNRATLVEELAGRFQLLGTGAVAADFKRVHDFSERVLDDMQLDILGSIAPRSVLHSRLAEELSEGQVVEVVGEAGSGKSALARSHLEEEVPDNLILAVSSRRLPTDHPGWDGFARFLSVKAPLSAILTEYSTATTPILLIDGAERIGSPGIWATINDIVKAIVASPAAGRWKILITSRKNNLRHRKQISFQKLNLVLGRVEVGDFTEEELDDISTRLPQLRKLVAKDSRTRLVAKRPYLLRRMAESGYSMEEGASLVSEVDLMLDFWRTTSNEGPDPDAALLERQEALVKLGARRLSNLDGPISSLKIKSSAISELIRDDVIRHNPDLRQAWFSHDIIEDWVLCLALQYFKRGIPDALVEAGESLRLIDPIQLLGQWRIEQSADHLEWGDLLTVVSAETLQPRWRRAILAAPLVSTRASDLLAKAEPLLWENDQSLLCELIGAMRTIEVDPNPYYLNFPLLPGYNEENILKISQMHAVPRTRSWQPFVNWFLPKLDNLPPSLVKETSLLLETIARGYDRIPDWMADRVAKWVDQNLRQLSYGDNFDAGYEGVRTYLNSIGVDRDEKFRDRLLCILLRCANGAPEVVCDHLRWMSEQKRSVGEEYVIENSHLLVNSAAKEIVDFLLSVCIMPPQQDDDFLGSRHSFTDFNDLGIEHDRLYFSPSHLRAPFLHLLSENETEGLRLIRGLCNAAMDRWLEILRDESSGTPVPLVLSFSWGDQKFWGHFREYTWNRGMGPGPNMVMSALMALEAWMEIQIDSDRDPSELFHAVLRDNYCVGVVGACCAILLKCPEECLPVSLPFLVSPKLWEWDVHRLAQDGNSNSNTMGFGDVWFRDAVAKRNVSPHRKLDIGSLVPYVFLKGTPQQKIELRDTVAALQNQNPDLEFEEQQENPEIVTEAKERIERMAAMCDPRNYKIEENEDGKGFQFYYVPPPNLAPSNEFLTQQSDFGEAMALAMWAEQSVTKGSIQERWALADAVEVVRRYQEEVDFSSGLPPVEDLANRAKLGALSGTAALALQYMGDDSEEFAWAITVVGQAAQMPLEDDGVTFADSAVMFHPVVMAAHGFLALVKNSEPSEEDLQFVLFLSLHPLNAVKCVIFEGLKDLWESEPALCWETLVLGARLCVMPEPIFSSAAGSDRLGFTGDRLKWVQEEFEKSVHALSQGENRNLPRIPRPWKLKDEGELDLATRESYERSDQRLLGDRLPTVLFSQPLDRLFETSERRIQVVQLLDDLMQWTCMRIAPPWETGHHTDVPYHWTNAFMEWCGLLLPSLAAEEREKLVIGPVRELLARREGENLLNDLLMSLARHHIGENEDYSSDIQDCWDELFNVVLSYPGIEWHQSRDFISSGFGECVLATIFFPYGVCVVPTPWSGIDRFKGHVERWVGSFGSTPAYFSYLVRFIMGPGKDLALDPGSWWISNAVNDNANNNEFWKNSKNGDVACDFIGSLIDHFPADIRENKPLFDQLVKASDVLLNNNVRPAAELQQRLAVLERRS